MNLYDLFQNFKISRAHGEARNAKTRAEGIAVDVRLLEKKVEKLSHLCQAMWEIMEEDGCSSARLKAKLAEVEKKSQTSAGKTSVVCNECGRKVSARAISCFNCGAKLNG
ncbi:hypothetical protein O5O45_08115 [Hahella aquimaris]|uniref:zinc ribbon domain-containing protein n=1 Tax=Hahella sp. HNIBRBA332 TaxID=3015983 RepID=UPI00273B325B|nr:hypothetical protein [Hahella sp. HNIBRBA332]WLQ15877.1 hypothetical protein O5O45_08115 [Hahella sp. HNIBRBA332]